MIIREETPEDHGAVRAVNLRSFESVTEADLVDALRESAEPIVSLVAQYGDDVVGHILFTPVTLIEHPKCKIMGLGPMAVKPKYRDKGIGSALVRCGLERCRKLGAGAVVVLGHADYYPRFDFVPSSRYDLVSEFDVPEGVFQVQELRPGYLDGRSGTIRYHEAFADA